MVEGCFAACLRMLCLTFLATLTISAGPTFDEFQERKAEDIKPQDVIHWQALEAMPTASGVEVALRMTTAAGWSVYQNNLEFLPPAGMVLGGIKSPPTTRIIDPVSGEEVDVYTGGEFFVNFSGPVDMTRDSLPVRVKYVGCTKVICLFPYTEVMEARLIMRSAPAPTPVQSEAGSASNATPSSTSPNQTPITVVAAGDDLQSQLAQQLTTGGLSFGALLLLVFVGGLLSNLTPCVYPMIPITLRLLARQGQSAFVSAGFYALGIVLTYSSLGLFAALSGSLFGALLASKTFNVVFALIMVILGLSMLGFGNFSKLQALGSRLGAGRPSPRNAFLMGTGAGLVAAPCTGPILAALLAYTAKGNAGLGASVALLCTYSVGFALPYLALGGAAAKVSQVRVPAQVQVGTKILFASAMFGLAFYYLRIPLYQYLVAIRPHWQTITLASFAMGLLAMLLWLLVPPLQARKSALVLPTLLLGASIFSASQWFTNSSHKEWLKTEEAAFAAAQAAGKPILIDMWAEWCEACKNMDTTTFVDPRVQAELSENWIALKLDLTEETSENDAIQKKYGLQSLPTLVLIGPDGRIEGGRHITGYVSATALLQHLNQYMDELKTQVE